MPRSAGFADSAATGCAAPGGAVSVATDAESAGKETPDGTRDAGTSAGTDNAGDSTCVESVIAFGNGLRLASGPTIGSAFAIAPASSWFFTGGREAIVFNADAAGDSVFVGEGGDTFALGCGFSFTGNGGGDRGGDCVTFAATPSAVDAVSAARNESEPRGATGGGPLFAAAIGFLGSGGAAPVASADASPTASICDALSPLPNAFSGGRRGTAAFRKGGGVPTGNAAADAVAAGFSIGFGVCSGGGSGLAELPAGWEVHLAPRPGAVGALPFTVSRVVLSPPEVLNAALPRFAAAFSPSAPLGGALFDFSSFAARTDESLAPSCVEPTATSDGGASDGGSESAAKAIASNDDVEDGRFADAPDSAPSTAATTAG